MMVFPTCCDWRVKRFFDLVPIPVARGGQNPLPLPEYASAESGWHTPIPQMNAPE